MNKYINQFRPSDAEINRRYDNIRGAMAANGIDALVVASSEYSGFEGAVRYLAGFHILHRYAYVLVTAQEAVAVFPKEATWVGDHSQTFLEQREFPLHCGEFIRDWLKARKINKVGVYGLEYIMNVRDYRAVAGGGFDIVDFELQFDYARAQKSAEELLSVRHSMEINKAGVLEVIKAYQPGKTEAELMGVAEQVFSASGCARNTMDMVQIGANGSLQPQMIFPTKRPVQASDGLMFGLEISGEGGHWVEYSRPLMPQGMDAITLDMMTAQQEFHALVREHMKAGRTAEEVHKLCMTPFTERGLISGHVCGHSIGMTMIEMPRIGEGFDFVLPQNMVCSMHPHVMNKERTHSLYFQETYLVTADGGEPLSGTAIKCYDGTETELELL
jgi:Xaa-Pro aminopeptidase